MKNMVYLLFIAVMLIAACQSKIKTASDDIDAIREIQDQSVAAVRVKDLNFIGGIYSSDAIEMPPDEPMAIVLEIL